MLSTLRNYYKLYKQKKLWRRNNIHNDTVMGNYFNVNDVNVGNYSYGILNVVSHNSGSKLTIGSFCSIASNVTFVLNGEHKTDCLSTFPFKAHCLKKHIPEAGSKGDIIIDDDVWIGTGATIMSGVHVKKGAVIAAGAVVVRDVEAYSIVGGVPARIIRKRFSDEIIKKLMLVDLSKFDQTFIERHIEELYTPISDESQINWVESINGIVENIDQTIK